MTSGKPHLHLHTQLVSADKRPGPIDRLVITCTHLHDSTASNSRKATAGLPRCTLLKYLCLCYLDGAV